MNTIETIEVPVCGKVVVDHQAKAKLSVEFPYRAELEKQGLFIAFQWGDDYEPIRVFFGSKWTGPFMVWHWSSGWQACFSHGNYGKNFACGGNWSAECGSLSHSWQEIFNYRFSKGIASGFDKRRRSCSTLESHMVVNEIVRLMRQLPGFENLQNPLA